MQNYIKEFMQVNYSNILIAANKGFSMANNEVFVEKIIKSWFFEKLFHYFHR